MTLEELKLELNRLNVPKHWYSINGDHPPDTYILQEVYTYWESYYIDERGGENNYRRFDNMSDACDNFYNMLKDEMRFFKRLD